MKAYAAVMAKRAAIEKRRQAERDGILITVVEYKEEARLELVRRKNDRRPRPEIIPHPDDLDIDPRTGAIVFSGPATPDQKMAQDLLTSAWPAIEQEWRDSPLSVAKDRRLLRQQAKLKRGVDLVRRLVARRASRINSWDIATLEEKMDYLRRSIWPTISKNFPPELIQSEICLKSTFRLWLGIEPTKEEPQALIEALKTSWAALSG